jgi:hypothetical protein
MKQKLVEKTKILIEIKEKQFKEEFECKLKNLNEETKNNEEKQQELKQEIQKLSVQKQQ